MSSPNKLTLNTNPLQYKRARSKGVNKISKISKVSKIALIKPRTTKNTENMGYTPFKMKGASLYTSPAKQTSPAKDKLTDWEHQKTVAHDKNQKHKTRYGEKSPAKSLFGLGEDNKAVKARNKVTRQENKEDRKEWRGKKKEVKKENIAAKKEYKKEKKVYKKDLKSKTSKGKHLSQAERRYFEENKADYSDEMSKTGSTNTTKLANSKSKKGKKRRKTIREDFKRDHARANAPVKPSKKLMRGKPEKKKREKLNTSIKVRGFEPEEREHADRSREQY